jgi:beta-galactosidase
MLLFLESLSVPLERRTMVRLYGHTWPMRWGDADEQKVVKVYSNCPTAELFQNGKSLGVKHRDMSDFPAAGSRWTTPFAVFS